MIQGDTVLWRQTPESSGFEPCKLEIGKCKKKQNTYFGLLIDRIRYERGLGRGWQGSDDTR